MPEDQHALHLKLVESLIQDNRTLASETRRRYAPIKEDGATALIETLWILMESNIEELRVLQTAILLLTTSGTVRGKLLARALTLCLRLHNSKTPATVNTAAAAIRQCACAVFDRVLKEEASLSDEVNKSVGLHNLRPDEVVCISVDELRPASKDAYRLFQDICALLNDEPAQWLTGTLDLNRSLGLELIESIITQFSRLFRQNVAFAYLLKTNLCPLVIKLFSPSLKLRPTPSASSPTGLAEVASAALAAAAAAVAHASAAVYSSSTSATSGEKATFPLLVRLKRLITVTVEQYFHLLNTECEIYLSLLIRFLDVEKTAWQRALALEVLHKFSAQPELIRHVCMSYDMRQHSTKIFRELVNTLSQYVQTVLNNPLLGDELAKESGQPNALVSPHAPNQSLLYYKGSFFLILQPTSFLVDLLDRSEAPTLQDGYCLSLAVSCLLRIVQTLNSIVTCPVGEDPMEPTTGHVIGGADVREQFVSLSWTGLLSAFALLLESSADEKITASLLESLQLMVGLCGMLKLEAARDAFIMTLCKSALPAPYARSLVVGSTNRGTTGAAALQTVAIPHEDAFERSPVAVVVTQGVGNSVNINTKPTTTGPASVPQSTTTSSAISSVSTTESHGTSPTGSLILTVKHLQAARAVLEMAQVYGNFLGCSWNIVLSTFQNLVWMLSLKVEPVAQLYFKPLPTSSTAVAKPPDGPLASAPGNQAQSGTPLLSSSATNDLAVLSSMLSALFTRSNELDATALNDLILGLCQLSSEAMELASVNKNPSQFPVFKLTEVGLVNIDRLNLWWDSVCCQLLSMCKLSHTELRQLAADALVTLIKQAISFQQTPGFWKNDSLTTVVLDPLSALSDVPYDDVRGKQLECVQHMLHCCGEQIGTCWLRLIEIIGVIRDSFKVDLIQTAFQCFKLIVTDYLSSLLPNCYPACVETAARFGHQKQDLNIALTAIGSILHLADYLLQLDGLPETKIGQGGLSLHDLWIDIFCKLADLCLDRRPAIRKSACQTLFNTVECHSARRFDEATWSALFWKVLFPLLTNVRELCASAPVERVDGRPNSLLIHHTRDTAAKQWAETVVLTLSGVAQLFVSKQEQLLAEYPKFWLAFLEQINLHAFTNSAEISVTALKALQILLEIRASQTVHGVSLWPPVWEAWLRIGLSSVDLRGVDVSRRAADVAEPEPTDESNETNGNGDEASSPTFVTLLFDLFIPLFTRTRSSFPAVDFGRLEKIIRLGVLTPLHVAYLYPQMASCSAPLPVTDDGTLSPLQEVVIRCVEFLLENIHSSGSDLSCHLVPMLQLVLALATYAVYIPKPEQSGPGRMEIVPLNYITFSEKCLQLTVDVYLAGSDWDEQSRVEVLEAIVKTLHKPLALKYGCPSQSTWLLASRCFFQVIPTSVPLLIPRTKQPTSFLKRRSDGTNGIREGLCTEIGQTLYDFLFYQQQPPSSLSINEFQQHEELDCKFINLISDLFLSSSSQLPDVFISRLVNLLSLGSVQATVNSAVTALDGSDSWSSDAGDSLFALDCNGLSTPEPDVPQSSRLQNKMGNSFEKSEKRRPRCSVGMAVRQTEVGIFGPGDPLTDSALNLDLNLDRLRQYAFREEFARLCFSKLLAHAFSGPQSTRGDEKSTQASSASQTVVQTNSDLSITVSRAAVRSILQRCRITLIQFFQAAQLTGKCPLPRARLVEIAYVFKALTTMLTSLQSVSSQRDVDPSTWNHVMDLYPHIVDCVLVTGGSQMTVALHRLLRLYGDLLRPIGLAAPGKHTTNGV
ncbi:hypothetical protein T265_09082 [Opisthorchis viverrini]|uniref:Protein MON2 homolog n=1 Tax=Opisthorchis viverrini TaxID=6198 RepID=A0A074Z736_OPIVI|nr:hypothetical protein T265_09082 [Opisthorchis viverrini]KER22908.1 hypothetical protein T265_09082 [Opisthorchis viverrini]